jgi:hypothetical protein
MKKPTRRNADKALCAYFTPCRWSWGLEFAQGKRLGIFMKLQTSVDPRTKKTYERNVIKTPEDRLVHMLYFQARHIADGYPSMPEEVLNDIGDNASVNSWRAHDPEIGFLRFLPDTPSRVLKIAEKRGWVTEQELESLQTRQSVLDCQIKITGGKSL